MENKKQSFKPGEDREMKPNKPAMFITGTGCRAYLWMGNDAEDDKACFATLSGMKTLEKLAFDILKSLGHKPNWILPKNKK